MLPVVLPPPSAGSAAAGDDGAGASAPDRTRGLSHPAGNVPFALRIMRIAYATLWPYKCMTRKASHAWTTPIRPARLTMTPRIAPPTPATTAHGLCDRPERSTRRVEPVEAAAEAPLDLRIVLTRLPAVRRRFKRCACGGSTPMAVRTGGARRPDARPRSSGSMLIPMDLGRDVTRRLCVRTRIKQSMALPMDLRTVLSVRPDVRGRVKQSMALPIDWHGGAGWGRGAGARP